ncbi:hypothetical protein Csa_023040 [Cucumis sativus]|nr:hypothetical protein Csa_023040 [Cucumis sativus]
MAADSCSGGFWIEEEKERVAVGFGFGERRKKQTWQLSSTSVNGERNRRTRWTARSGGGAMAWRL